MGLINNELKSNYGVIETNPILPGYHKEESEYIDWEELKNIIYDKQKHVKVERIRFITDIGFPCYDCSYFHVRIDNKRYEILNHPFSQVKSNKFKTNLYNILKKEGVYLNGFFDNISILK